METYMYVSWIIEKNLNSYKWPRLEHLPLISNHCCHIWLSFHLFLIVVVLNMDSIPYTKEILNLMFVKVLYGPSRVCINRCLVPQVQFNLDHSRHFKLSPITKSLGVTLELGRLTWTMFKSNILPISLMFRWAKYAPCSLWGAWENELGQQEECWGVGVNLYVNGAF